MRFNDALFAQHRLRFNDTGDFVVALLLSRFQQQRRHLGGATGAIQRHKVKVGAGGVVTLAGEDVVRKHIHFDDHGGSAHAHHPRGVRVL